MGNGAGTSEGELFQTHIGRSAVTEGVMMRGRCGWAVSVRKPSDEMYVEEHPLPGASERPAWQRLPLVRGCVSVVTSLSISYQALMVAADHAFEDEPEDEPEASEPSEAPAPSAASPESEPAPPAPASPNPLSWYVSIGVGVLLGVCLFFALPVAVASLLLGELRAGGSLAWNLVEAAVRLAVLFAYMWGVGRLPDMARVFAYHGAEHQAIHCYEHGLDLTPENCARFSRLHVRCGTAFLVMALVVAILVNTLAPVGQLADALGAEGAARSAVVLATRLVLLPLVVGVSYEVTVTWAGGHPQSPLVRVVLWPGLQMQRLTTRVPDRGMLECAISSLVRVRAQEVRAGRA